MPIIFTNDDELNAPTPSAGKTLLNVDSTTKRLYSVADDGGITDVALHELDAPWTPARVTQRIGRGIRRLSGYRGATKQDCRDDSHGGYFLMPKQ